MATEKSLERCRTDHFDCLMLHNPDSIGYTKDTVWEALVRSATKSSRKCSAWRRDRPMASRSISCSALSGLPR